MQCSSVNLFWCATQNDLVKWGIPQNVGQPSQLIVCWLFIKQSLTEKDFAKLDGQTVDVIILFSFRKPAKKVNITYFGAQVIPLIGSKGTSQWTQGSLLDPEYAQEISRGRSPLAPMGSLMYTGGPL